VLVIIDLQEKLAAAMPPGVYERLQSNVLTLIEAASILSIPIICTLQYPRGLGPLDTRIRAALPESAALIEKTCFSCDDSAAFTDCLQKTDKHQLLLAGMEAHICVLQTALALRHRGHQIFTIQDAVSSRRRSHYENAIERLKQAGIPSIVTESVLFEWLRDSTHPQFKPISKLIRQGSSEQATTHKG